MNGYAARSLFILFFLTTAFISYCQLEQQWEIQYKNSKFKNFRPTHVTTDYQDNFITTGSSYDPSTDSYTHVVAKQSKEGKKIWTTILGPFQRNNSIYSSIIGDPWVSPTGAVYVAATETFAKLDAYGNIVWQKEGGLSMARNEEGLFFLETSNKIIAYDTAGAIQWSKEKQEARVLMAAGKYKRLYLGYGATLAAFNFKGEQLWQQQLQDKNGLKHYVASLIADENGNVFATASHDGSTGISAAKKISVFDGPYGDFITQIYYFSKEGKKIWDTAAAFAFDMGDPKVLHVNKNGTLVINDENQICVYQKTGNLLWRSLSGQYIFNPNSTIYIDDKDMVYLVSRLSDYQQSVFRKYSPEGNIILEREIKYDYPLGLAVNAKGDIGISGIQQEIATVRKYTQGSSFNPITFSLVDANADTILQPLKQSDFILLSRRSKVNIVANVTDAITSSVKLELGNEYTTYHTKTENHAPYTLFGNKGSNFHAWKPTSGSYSVSAKAYAYEKAKGSSGGPYTVQFTLAIPEVYSFNLVNATNDQYQFSLQDGATYTKSQLPALVNIIAYTAYENYIGSVQFRLNSWHTIENIPPFALAGNKGLDYKGFDLKAGTYTLTASLYRGKAGTGEKLNSHTIHFKVVNDHAAQPALVQERKTAPVLPEVKGSIEVIPNPFRNQATIIITPVATGPTTVRLYHTNGHLIQHIYNGQAFKGRSQTLQLNRTILAAGIYTLQLVTGPYTLTRKVVISP